jgi:hypothetical protein
MVRASSIIRMEACMMAAGRTTRCRAMDDYIISQVCFYIILGKIAYEGDWVADQFTGKGTLYNEKPDQI